MIKDLKDTMNAYGVYLLKSVKKFVASNGKPYVLVSLQDNSGTIDAKKWDVSNSEMNLFVPGNVVRVDGTTSLYRDKLQITIEAVYAVDINEIDVSSLVPDSPIAVDDLISKFNFYKDSVEDKDYKKLLDIVFEKYYKDFINYPAAVSNHHEFHHGLIYHTVSMCDYAKAICSVNFSLNYDLLITGCLLHDIGKTIELSGVVATTYTEEGNLLGHISIGFALVKEICDQNNIDKEKSILIEHMILSHHGEREFGAPVLPSFKEAVVLSYIDRLDSEMMEIDKAYEKTNDGEFTERIFPLDNQIFYKNKK